MASPPKHGLTKAEKQIQSRAMHRVAARSMHQLIALARSATPNAMRVLVNMALGQKMIDGKMQDWPGLPPAVQLRAIEILFERGYGKVPQAIDLKGDQPGAGAQAIPILERIERLRQQMLDSSTTRDLEASEIQEIADEVLPVEVNVTPPSTALVPVMPSRVEDCL